VLGCSNFHNISIGSKTFFNQKVKFRRGQFKRFEQKSGADCATDQGIVASAARGLIAARAFGEEVFG
jgi:hypothetical protein